MKVVHYYRLPGLSEAHRRAVLSRVRQRLGLDVAELRTEVCFNVGLAGDLSDEERERLEWLLAETFEPERFAPRSLLDPTEGPVVEVGPRLNFTTAWSTNAVGICRAAGILSVVRLERSRRYQPVVARPLEVRELAAFTELVHDRMTEQPYPEPLASFAHGVRPAPVRTVPVLAEGRKALERINAELGLAWDDWDLDYYTRLFAEVLRRDPTDVELFDMAQSNSEHSRHWFFKGRLVIDGEEAPEPLMAVVRAPLEAERGRSVLAFEDNSSGIRGFTARTLLPARAGGPGPLVRTELEEHVIFTAETHNFPTGVAPFPGAETGTGGRIRDVHATGRGAQVVAGTAGYCVGNLRIPGYEQPWEDPSFLYPHNLASPLEIEIEASNGASDYGNKFGEPVIAGFTRSFGMRLPDGSRREWIKPIMFSGGIGRIDDRHLRKGRPEPAMLVVKVGGPAYRIGIGGGAASSMVQGTNPEELDFGAVQRGDAEMEQKLHRVIRACVELGEANPIVSIHDQGAGGNCNVLKELVEPEGARIEIRSIPVGDETLSVLEIWGAEYQENDALLLRPEHRDLFAELCAREKLPWAVVGEVTGDGRIVVHDAEDGSTPVNLPLDLVLGDMPRKVFRLERTKPSLRPLELPPDLTVREALERVLRLVAVGSKRFLTNKVDRAVTGLIARQQCVGPLHLPLADVAVVAQSHLATVGAATAIGERPTVGLLDPAAMARLAVAEALTNLVWAPVTALEDVRCSANWMWAAKLPGEGAALYDAAVAMRDAMLALGIAVDGGKDSLSMAALAPDGRGGEELVKAPPALVISAYVTCPDITGVVTPDLELPGEGRLVFIDLSGGRNRLGGSALAQAYGELGNEPPDLDDPTLLGRAFRAVQEAIGEGLVTAGHDRSDGGLVTTLLEMAFAGNCGLEAELPDPTGRGPLAVLFAEEPGLVVETPEEKLPRLGAVLERHRVPYTVIGRTVAERVIRLAAGGATVLEAPMPELRDLWEATSFQLERLQADPECVAQEQAGLAGQEAPPYRLAFEPRPTPPAILERASRPRVAVLREEGSNGDREMAAAFWAAGFEPWDVTVTDLSSGRVELARFRGVAAVGGFSYADVLDSAKGWAAAIRFHDRVREQFERFLARSDTFALGVCNGCQLFALLGWVGPPALADRSRPRFVHNASGRFESRFATVRIEPGPSIFLRGMEGSVLGIWVQHGEGRALFPDADVLAQVEAQRLAPVRYVDQSGEITEGYPANPNGSPHGIAALSSPDGRVLAMMPHPERTFLPWQWPWRPRTWREQAASPWLRLFQNAYRFCEEVQPSV